MGGGVLILHHLRRTNNISDLVRVALLFLRLFGVGVGGGGRVILHHLRTVFALFPSLTVYLAADTVLRSLDSSGQGERRQQLPLTGLHRRAAPSGGKSFQATTHPNRGYRWLCAPCQSPAQKSRALSRQSGTGPALAVFIGLMNPSRARELCRRASQRSLRGCRVQYQAVLNSGYEPRCMAVECTRVIILCGTEL